MKLQWWLLLCAGICCSCTTGAGDSGENVGRSAQAISFVQVTSAAPQSPVSTVSVSFAHVTAGDALVVAVGWNDTTHHVTGVTDSLGDTFTAACSTEQNSPLSQTIYVAVGIRGGADTITTTWNGATAYVDVRAAEYSGVNTIDTCVSAHGATSTASAGPIHTAQANELLVAGGMTTQVFRGAGSGWTKRVITSPDGDILEDRIAATSGNYTATASTSADPWVLQVVALLNQTLDGGPDSGSDGSGDATGDAANEATGDAAGDTTGDATEAGDDSSAADGAADVMESGPESGDDASDANGDADAADASGPDAGSDAGSDAGDDGGPPPGPALVQHVSESSTRGSPFLFGPPWCYRGHLALPTTAGNSVLVALTYQNDTSVALSDDASDTYSVAVSQHDSADGRTIVLAGAFNVAAGARQITFCFAADPGLDVQPAYTEWAGLTGFDGAGVAAFGNGATAAPGAVGVGGDVIYSVAASLSLHQSSWGASGILLSADDQDGYALQYGGSATPTFTLGTSDHWLAAAVAATPGTTGSTPSGIRILHLEHINLPFNVSAGGTGSAFPNPTSIQFPSTACNLAAAIAGGVAVVTSVTDNRSNAWVASGAYETRFDTSAQKPLTALGATCDPGLNLSIAWDSTASDQTAMLYDLAGVSAVIGTAGATGEQLSAGSLHVYNVTAAAVPAIAIHATAWDQNTALGLLNGLVVTPNFDGENVDGPGPTDENNGWGHTLLGATSPVAVTWTPVQSGRAFSKWSSTSVILH